MFVNGDVFAQINHKKSTNSVAPVRGKQLPAAKIERYQNAATENDKGTSTIFLQTFESGIGSWVTRDTNSVSNTPITCWQVGTPTSGPSAAHGGTKLAATKLAGDYVENTHAWLISPNITLTASAGSSVKMHFWEWFNIETYFSDGNNVYGDGGFIYVKPNGGTWQQIDIPRNGECLSWRQSIVDLTSFANQTVQIAFMLDADDAQNYAGWYIDDIAIKVTTPAPLSVSLNNLNFGNFPFIYANVNVQTNGTNNDSIPQSAFSVTENNTSQTEYFQVTRPNNGGNSRLADFVFVLDLTNSMEEEITAVKNNIISFVNQLESSGINYAVGIVVFGDTVYSYNQGNLYTNRDTILAKINQITLGEHNIGAGDDISENQYEAMATAALMNFRPGAQKVQILLTDADPHTTNWTNETLINNRLLPNNISVYPIFDNSKPLQLVQYIPIAQRTNTKGKYYHIFDNFNTIVNDISAQVGSTYLVRYRSSSPEFDGVRRNVNVSVNFNNTTKNDTDFYLPGAAPRIVRTASTLAYHSQAWSENTPFTIQVEITDIVTPYTTEAKLFYKNADSAQYIEVAMAVLDTLYPNVWQAIIPTSAVYRNGMNYYITATDGVSNTSSPNLNPTENPYQIAILPNVAPAITNVLVNTQNATRLQPLNISAKVIDITNQVVSVTLHYRNVGDILFQNIAMTTNDSIYNGQFPANTVDRNIEYYIAAKDNFNVYSYYGNTDSPNLLTFNFFPTRQADSLAATNISQNQFSLNYRRGNGVGSCILIAKTSTALPTISDSLNYVGNTTFGQGTNAGNGWFCVFTGIDSTDNPLIITGLDGNSTYRTMVFSYNISGDRKMHNPDIAVNNPLNVTTLPEVQATNVTFTNTELTQTTAHWTRGTGAKCAVFVLKTTSATSGDFPIVRVNTTYTANSVFGQGTGINNVWFCVYNGTGDSVTITNLQPSSYYRIAVVEYKGATGAEKYNSQNLAANNNPKNTRTLLPELTTWNGTSWDFGRPNEDVNASIAGLYIVGEHDGRADLKVKNLTITTSGKLTVNAQKYLIVKGNFTILSSARGTGSYVSLGGFSCTGNCEMKCFINDGNSPRVHWFSTPMRFVSTSVLGNTVLLKRYTDTTDYNVTETQLAVFKGYEVKFPVSSKTITYTGTPATTPFNKDTYSPGISSTGFYLLGNPYPCALDWKSTNGWTKTNVTPTIYFKSGQRIATFNATTNESTYGATQYIPAMQGFRVYATATGAAILLNNNARVHHSQTYWKEESDFHNVLRLKINNTEQEGGETVIAFDNNATENFDFELDAFQIFEEEDNLTHLYTQTADGNLSSVNSMQPTSVVPVFFKAGQNGNYTISATELRFGNTEIYLEDVKTGIFTDLRSSQYDFSYSTTEPNLRFKVHFGKPNSVNNLVSAKMKIYSFEKEVYVSGITKNSQIEIFDISGKLIFSKNVNSDFSKISLQTSGIYLVKIQNSDGITTEKVVIR